VRYISLLDTDAEWFVPVLAVAEKRNCIPLASRGDKCYRLAEHAPDFFKHGVTVPLVNFG